MDKSKSTLKENIIARIEALIKERDVFVIDANKNIAAYNGAISELQRLIEPEKQEAQSKKTDEA
jgi:F420-0:gamma-glutamyl ligase